MTKSKKLMCSNDHIKEIEPGEEGRALWYPPLGETLLSFSCPNLTANAGKQLSVDHIQASLGRMFNHNN